MALKRDSILTITVKAPGACDTRKLTAFEELARKGGEVQSHSLPTLIRQANALAFAHSAGRLVAVGALKQPLASYRKSVFEKSVAPYVATQFPIELGWVYVLPSERRKGISRRLVEALLKTAPDVSIFATSKTDNAPMHRSLERNGFVRVGNPYTSTRGRHRLQLFVRSAAQTRAERGALRTSRPVGAGVSRSGVSAMPRSCSVEEEIYTHEYLWRSASVLLQKAETEEQASYHLLLPSLLISFMAFEAFVNFCGFVLLPELWKEEKKHFRGKGVEGKLEVLVTKLPTFSWRKGEPPYQRIKTLEAFRDIVAHGKVVATQYVAKQQKDGSHFRFNHAWDSYLSVSAVQQARKDVKSFSQSLLVELRKTSDHLHLSFDAFEGSLASGASRSG